MVYKIPTTDTPIVSIIIPLYGGKKYLETCLRCLLLNTDAAFELIFVDNKSPDGAANWIEENVEGAQIIRNAENLGFAQACNQGAAEARSDTLCFLNADAFVRPGWLHPLLDDINSPNVGAAVPMFRNIDGTLQQAGNVVDSQANGIFWGVTDRPNRLRFRFRRTVDYGSAACLVIKKEVFDSVNGFDPIFGLAYYEDIDLGFRLRQQGWQTMYEPRSQVTHVWGGSTPHETAHRLRTENQKLFADRWNATIAWRSDIHDADIDQYPHRLNALRDAVQPHRVLVVSETVPSATSSSVTGDLLGSITGSWPLQRVALLTLQEPIPNSDTRHWLSQGVEIWDEPGGPGVWLRHRLAHFDAILDTASMEHTELREQLRRTQPQAAYTELLDTQLQMHEIAAALGWPLPASSIK